MCGICGVAGSELPPAARAEAVQRMSDAMAHRGPDDAGMKIFGQAVIGMRRLAIQDISALGHQPMTGEDGSTWVVFNGEIYNFPALRSELLQSGHRFRSRTDTETIIHLYEERGTGAFDKLRGMFGLAIWDETRRELVLTRDRLGIKPLYYAMLPGAGVIFASELRALLASGLVPRELDREALDGYMTFGYVPPPSTLIRGVCVLLPGHAARWRDGRFDVWRWWQPPAPGATDIPIEEAPARLRQLLEDSIRAHRLSDVPVGAFLSGGIDSTAVVGLMSRVIPEPVRTFSVGFSDGPAHLNELAAARLAAAAFDTTHTEVVLNGRDVLDTLAHALDHIDQPSFDGINTYIVSKAAREGGVTVALSGLGGDELFGGYDTFAELPRLSAVLPVWRALPESVRHLLLGGVAATMTGERHKDRRRKLQRLAGVRSPIDLYAFARQTMTREDVDALYRDRMAARGPIEILSSAVENPVNTWDLVTSLEMTCFMGWRLLRDTDAMSMAQSLEVRVPLIDHPIVEFVRGLPAGWHRRFGHPKRLLTDSLHDILPPQLLNRPKQGFAFPLEYWMRHDLAGVVRDTLAEKRIDRRGLFRPAAVRALVDQFDAGRLPYPAIWQLVVLEQWMARVFDGPEPAPLPRA